ncbi:hypothetical protein A3759_01010 [Thalassolituus sp. HI0120]|nr:hypothetical protein A3759_01010 [Thalassolituus sp. HI0120]
MPSENNTVSVQDMKALVYGGCFLASGGGGPVSMALNFLEKINQCIPLIPTSQLKPGKKSAIVADLGSPDAATEGRGYTAPVNAYKSLNAYLKQQENKEIEYFLPAEIGAVNTLIPFFIASQFNPPLAVIDADPSGRAVPQMNESMLEVNQVPCCPAIIASDTNDGANCKWSNESFHSELFTNKTPTQLEDAAREVVSQPAYEQVGGMACWPIDSDYFLSQEAKSSVIHNSVSAAIKVGYTILNSPEPKHLVETLNALGIDNYVIDNGLVRKVINRTSHGFDVGKIVFATMVGELWIYYKNESLLGWDPQTKKPLVIAPDCINLMKFKDSDRLYGTSPISTADVKEGQACTIWATACAEAMRNKTIEKLFLTDIDQITSAFPEDDVKVKEYIPVQRLNP